jgi:putative tricarboxylic transport membrane protein
VIGLVLLLLGLLLLVRSLRERRQANAARDPALDPSVEPAGAARPAGTLRRALGSVALCLVYALGLLGRLPFEWATGLFVFGFVVAFGLERARPWRSLAGAATMAVCTAVAVTLLFERLFLVRLP